MPTVGELKTVPGAVNDSTGSGYRSQCAVPIRGSTYWDRFSATAFSSFTGEQETTSKPVRRVRTGVIKQFVIGGGLTGAAKYFMPALLEEMNSETGMMDGSRFSRLQSKAFNLDDEADFNRFARGEAVKIPVPGSDRQVDYDPCKRIGVMISKQGAAIKVMACAMASPAISPNSAKARRAAS